MNHLNYHHLFYFWTVAKLGGVSAAAKELHLAQPTISKQIRQLEDQFGKALFQKSGRKLVLTSEGRLVFQYAEQIFSTGQELLERMKGEKLNQPRHLKVGVPMVIPKLVVYRLLKVVVKNFKDIILTCTENNLSELLAQLSVHQLDLVLSDTPIPPMISVKAYNHLLGTCGISFLGKRNLKDKYRSKFPHSLDDAPFLLPTDGTVLRRALFQWFGEKNIRPRIIAEFQDSALMKVFAKEGHGVFAVPTVIEAEVIKRYRVELIGRSSELEESFYAISVERHIKHPAVKLISEEAQKFLFQEK